MKRSILLRTFIIVTVATLLMFGMVFAALHHTSVMALRQQALENASTNLDVIRTYLNSLMRGINEYIYLFTMNDVVKNGDTDEITAYFRRFVPSDSIITTRLLLIDGELAAMDTPLLLASMSPDAAFYQSLSKRGRLVVTAPYYSKLTAERTVAVVRSLVDAATGREIVLVCELRTRNLFDELTQKLSSRETLVVLDSAGNTVYFSPTTSLLSGLVAGDVLLEIGETTRRVLMSLKSGVQQIDIDGRGVMVERLRYNEQWSFYFIIDTDQFYAAANALIRSYLIFAGPAAAIFVIVCVLVSAGVIRPIKKLSKQADALVPGADALKLTPPGQDELDRLAMSFNSLLERLEKAGKEKEMIERQHFQMEYKVLQSQIQPHFLFNIHMCVDGLLEQGEVDKAREMLSSLDMLLRDSTDKMNSLIPLRDEMQMLNHYLTLQNMRMGEALSVVIGDWSPYENMLVPKLLLQPIVENAIQHGLTGITWRGELEISFDSIDGKLHIWIRDNGRGIPEETLHSLERGGAGLAPSQRGMVSIGLDNVRSRIKSLYGEECGLYIFSRVNLGTTVELVIDDAPRGMSDENM